jgi:hypothetical protein
MWCYKVSNLNNEQYYEDFSESLDFILEQFKKGFNTSLPAIIQSYDSTTKRAQVLPAIKRLFTDGTSQSLPILIDVPIIFPSAGGFTITMPITKGDSVLLIFTQRGITNFKNQFTESMPTNSLLSIQDAVAIVGFGALQITPSSSTGCTMQNNQGSNAVIIEDGKVEIKKGSNTVIVDDSQMQATIQGATLTLNSSALISSVPVMAPSFSGLSGGVANMTSGINMAGQDITGANAVVAGGVNLTTHYHIDSQGGSTGQPLN